MSILQSKKKLEQLSREIKNSLIKHHQLYCLPVKGELWENVLANCLKSIDAPNDWRPDFNHAPGLDMTLEENSERISCKSGSIVKEDLEFSGSRMTKHLTLEDKLTFMSDKKEDTYMLLSRNNKSWTDGDRKYYFIAFPSSLLNYNDLNWSDTVGTRGAYKGKVNGHLGTSSHISAKIQFSMSHQLWTTIRDFKKDTNIFVREIPI